MTLENFRKLRIRLEDVNKPILKKIMAKEGDYNGRELEIQILDGPNYADLANATVTLFWKHLDMGNSGSKNFTAVDRSKGIFSITYPPAMLNEGNVLAYVSVAMPGRIVPTVDFIITVEGSGFDAVAAVASDDFQALNDALMQVKDYQKDIDAIKENLRNQADALLKDEESEFNALQSEYENLVNSLRTQFNDAVANLTQDSEVITARTSTITGDNHASLSDRLDEMETMTVLEDHKAYFEIKDGRPRLRLEEF